MKKGFIFLKSIGPRNTVLIDGMQKSGHLASAWDEEGMTFFEKEYQDRRLHTENLEKLSMFFTWGEVDTQIIKKNYPSLSEKIHKVGNSRIDVLKSPYHKIYDKEAELIKKKYGKFFLFPTLFTQCNAANVYNMTYVNDLLNQGYKEDSPCVKIGKAMTFQQEQILIETKKFFEEFSKQFPEKKLIVRPHPSEKIDYWFDLVKKYKNIDIVFDDQSTCSWIVASEMLISTNCTTAIEAFFLKKKTINFLPYKDESVEYLLPKAVSKVIRSNDDLILEIKNHENIKNYELKDENSIIIKEWLDNAFDYCSVEKTIGILENFSEKNNIKFDNNVDRYSNKFFLNAFKSYRRIFNKLNNFYLFLINKSYMHRLILQKFPSLTVEEIKKKIDYFSKFLGEKNFIVKEIYPGIFVIEMNKEKK
jgi:surface carbohydrate biosynthesis protein